jgi:hypothetical protein
VRDALGREVEAGAQACPCLVEPLLGQQRVETLDAAHDVAFARRRRHDGELAGHAVAVDHVAEAVQKLVGNDVQQRAAIGRGRGAMVHVLPVVAVDVDERATVVDQ